MEKGTSVNEDTRFRKGVDYEISYWLEREMKRSL